jgi:hypothetical protein
MSLDEMYSHTPRSFFNAVDGYRKKEDSISKERWVIAREIIFATIQPYLKNGEEKHDIITFEWEVKELEKIKKQNEKSLLENIESVKDFWERQDNAVAK